MCDSAEGLQIDAFGKIARQLITALSTELSIPVDKVLAFMCDRASVNGVAMRTISVLYSKMIDVG